MKEKPIWPEGLTGYKRTPEFTENKIPAALLRDHATRDGVWGRIHILEGSLGFVDQVDGSRVSLAPGVHACIFPGRLHHVALEGVVRFCVEFCRAEQELAQNPSIDADVALPHRRLQGHEGSGG